MAILKYRITAAEDGCTVRDILTAQFHISTSLRKQLRRRDGAILLNDTPVTVAQTVRCGDVLVEYDKLIDRQLERAAITSISGFGKICDGAAAVLNV